ncbi:UNVERIFIED_CONTAM: hypothetical protein H355_010405 [Colinus virginianus]|nr:hypothetical protein H355_010405 [Colinus virginianus]
MASPLPPYHPSSAPEMDADVFLGPGMREKVLEEGGHQQETPAPVRVLAAGSSPASIPGPGGLQVGVKEQRNSSLHASRSDPPAVQWGQTVSRGQELWGHTNGPVFRRMEMSGQPREHAELGLPWVMEYFPVRSCHVIFQNGSGVFYLPLYGDIQADIWCNWTIWAGPQKHIVIYIQGFQGSEGCGKNQDKIIFQGVLSHVETKVMYACHSQVKIQSEVASLENKGQHFHNLVEGTWLGADLGEHSELQGETEMERSLTYGGMEGREPNEDVWEAPSGGGAGSEAELLAVEAAEGDVELVSALITTTSHYSADVLVSEVMPQGDKGVPAGDVLSPGEGQEDLFDLASVLASLDNSTALQSLHHPGDVLFEIMTEIKHKDWITPGGGELRRDLLESLRSHIQQNLKLSANRVNEIKLKEVKRTSNASLLLTFWLHLKPEERNMSVLLRSQLGELLSASVEAEKLQLMSLLVEDVNECSLGVTLCGEEAECFNGVGTYLCRCKKGYEDHSPTKSGTLCIRTPLSGLGFLLRHADILVGASITASLALLVAAGALCCSKWRRRRLRRVLGPEESPERAMEEPPVMELQDLEDCLRLDPFQLKLRARPPEWLWGARAHPGQAYRVFLEQSSPL